MKVQKHINGVTLTGKYNSRSQTFSKDFSRCLAIFVQTSSPKQLKQCIFMHFSASLKKISVLKDSTLGNTCESCSVPSGTAKKADEYTWPLNPTLLHSLILAVSIPAP
jgi:hypothetical protein